MKLLVALSALFVTFNCALASTNVTCKFNLAESVISIDSISYLPESESLSESDGLVVVSPAVWELRVQIDINRGAGFELTGVAWELDRFRIYKTFTLTVADMHTLLGEDYSAVLFAVQHGEYYPDGEINGSLIGYIIAEIARAE